MNPQITNRYPGIRSFEENEQALFFGRDQEIEDLLHLIKVKRLVVMFAKSGIGKTSLLNAGVGPLLEAENILPIKVRFQNTDYSPLETIVEEIKPELNADIPLALPSSSRDFGRGRDKLFKGGILPHETQPILWEYLKAGDFEAKGKTPLLIFDQFEEYFYHDKDKRTKATLQLADLVNERLPDVLQQQLRAIPRRERTPEQLAWFSPLNCKIVFIIRSDKLHLMDEMTTPIPSILKTRYQLRPLQKEQAKAAILQPAAIKGEHFLTPPFAYKTETIDEIVQHLSNSEGEIESFQLQILCGEIERQVKSKIQIQAQNSNTQTPITNHESPITNNQPPITVTPDYLGGKSGINKILNDYYESRITELGSESDQQAARKLIEEELIADGKRVGVATEKVKIGEQLLDKLLLSRIIRVSNTHLGKSYEISHDTLVEPILKSYERRKLEEERLQRERERAEERRKRRRALMIGLLGFLMLLGAVALAGYAISQRSEAIEKGEMAAVAQAKADSSTQIAKEQQMLAEQSLQVAETAKCTADSLLVAATEAQNQAAKEKQTADKAKKEASEAQNAVAAAEKDIEVKKKEVVELILEQVDKLFLQLDYEQALEKTDEAADLKVLEKEVVKRYMECIYWHSETHQYAKARKILQTALRLNPNAQAQSLLQKSASMGDKKALQASLQVMDANHLQFLKKRYYPTMIKVKGGQFTMGCDTTLNQKCQDDEVLHEAIVSDFAIAETETTVFQFALYCQAEFGDRWFLKGSYEYKYMDGATAKSDSLGLNPVVKINWYDAVLYANWLSEQKGKKKAYKVAKEEQDPNNKSSLDDIRWKVDMLAERGYRLPTEAEWEYAARGGAKGKNTVYAGEGEIGGLAWYRENSSSRTHPVGTKKPNELGLYDMSGNVYEWCFDWYGEYPKDTLITDYFGLESGSYRVLRGGSWYINSENCRVAIRDYSIPFSRNDYGGFRVACSL